MEGATRRLMSVFERTTLDNGLRLLTASLPQVASTTVFVFFAAGTRYETEETNGIAHFAEHMFFKGTERRPTARDIGMAIDGIGGEFNAFTGKEYTGYYVRCASEHQGIALDVLTDMLRHSKFEEEEIDREKGVIIEEMNMYFDTPRDYIGGVYDSLMYGDQPLGWDIIGRKETVRAATRATFLDYIDRWYKPSRTVVGVAGRLDDGTHSEVARLLGDLEPAETPPKPPLQPLPNGQGPHVRVFTKTSDQAHLVLGVPSKPLDHPDRYILQVLATILGGGMSSRLFTEVRERRRRRTARRAGGGGLERIAARADRALRGQRAVRETPRRLSRPAPAPPDGPGGAGALSSGRAGPGAELDAQRLGRSVARIGQ